MGRTRSGVLEAAAEVVAERGTKRASMTDIAAAAGVAKGTLYNHFRTKDDVWAALAEAEVRRLAAECRDLPLASALRYAAERIATHPVVRRLAGDEPAMLAALLTAGPAAPGWTAAHEAVSAALVRAGADESAADLVLRWLASHLTAADPRRADATARLLAAALPVAVPPAVAAPPVSVPPAVAAPPVAVPPAVAGEVVAGEAVAGDDDSGAAEPEAAEHEPAAVPAGAAQSVTPARSPATRPVSTHELWSGLRTEARGAVRQPAEASLPGAGERGGRIPDPAQDNTRPGLTGGRAVTDDGGFLPFI